MQKRLNTKWSTTWHCAPGYVSNLSWCGVDLLVVRFRTARTGWQDNIQSEYCSCPGHKESLDFPRLEHNPQAPSRLRFLGVCYSYQLSDDKRTPPKQNLPRLECCYYIKQHFSAPNFRAEKLVLLLKTVPYK